MSSRLDAHWIGEIYLRGRRIWGWRGRESLIPAWTVHASYEDVAVMTLRTVCVPFTSLGAMVDR